MDTRSVQRVSASFEMKAPISGVPSLSVVYLNSIYLPKSRIPSKNDQHAIVIDTPFIAIGAIRTSVLPFSPGHQSLFVQLGGKVVQWCGHIVRVRLIAEGA